jgi:hypothetical protein
MEREVRRKIETGDTQLTKLEGESIGIRGV